MFAVVVGSNEQAPVVEVWEDFQCVQCRELHEELFPLLDDLLAAGKVRLAIRPVTLLDARQDSTSSLDAVAAWGCAVDAGKALEYRAALFDSQPPVRGEVRSPEEFITIAHDVGVDGPALAQFISCLELGTYRTWAANSASAFFYESVPRIPWMTVAGEPVDVTDARTPAAELLTYR